MSTQRPQKEEAADGSMVISFFWCHSFLGHGWGTWVTESLLIQSNVKNVNTRSLMVPEKMKLHSLLGLCLELSPVVWALPALTVPLAPPLSLLSAFLSSWTLSLDFHSHSLSLNFSHFECLFTLSPGALDHTFLQGSSFLISLMATMWCVYGSFGSCFYSWFISQL